VKDTNNEYMDSMQVEEAFYQAFRSHDIELMKQVWHQSDEVYCIHPGSSRIFTYQLIIASWEHIFSGKEEINIQLSGRTTTINDNLSIHNVKEVLTIDQREFGSVLATNIYRQTHDQGWKMIGHHGSPAFMESDTRVNNNLH